MSKKDSEKTKKYTIKYNYEDSFICDVRNISNCYSNTDIKNQKNAIKNLIKYVKLEKEKGTSYEEVRDKVLYNMINLVTSIRKPTIKDFYQLRTIESINGIDIKPYLEDIINSKIDVKKYVKDNWVRYSADVSNNIKIELCGLISEFLIRRERTSNKEFLDLCEKIENNALEMSDINLLKKYILASIKELKMGGRAFWEKIKKDPEHCRKIMYRCRNRIFDVENPENNYGEKEEKLEQKSQQDFESVINEINNDKTINLNTTRAINVVKSMQKDYKKVKIKKYDGFPFLGDFEQENFLFIMSYALRDTYNEMALSKMYEYLCASEYSSFSKHIIHRVISGLGLNKNMYDGYELLKDRIAVLTNFFYVTGNLEHFCSINNGILSKIGLEKFNIGAEELYKKFVNNTGEENQYFYNEYTRQNSIRKSSELDSMSNEAIVAMSALYSNRMAKCIPKYTILAYIMSKKSALEKIYNNPDLEYEDLGFSDEDIRTYMALYTVLQDKIKGNYFERDSEGNTKFVDNSYEEIYKKTRKYEKVYNEYYKDLELDFEDDILNVMFSIRLIEDMYKLKVFSTKSLLYMAIVDKNKNIINWGYVKEENPEDSGKVLLAFDVKTLNMPVFVHVGKGQIIEYLQDLTGDTKLPMYEGAMDMYNYTVQQWVGTSVLYPLSKEQRKLMKDATKEKQQLKAGARFAPLYQHMKWLQFPNKKPEHLREPGTRIYDLAKDKEIKRNTKKETDQR